FEDIGADETRQLPHHLERLLCRDGGLLDVGSGRNRHVPHEMAIERGAYLGGFHIVLLVAEYPPIGHVDPRLREAATCDGIIQKNRTPVIQAKPENWENWYQARIS